MRISHEALFYWIMVNVLALALLLFGDIKLAVGGFLIPALVLTLCFFVRAFYALVRGMVRRT